MRARSLVLIACLLASFGLFAQPATAASLAQQRILYDEAKRALGKNDPAPYLRNRQALRGYPLEPHLAYDELTLRLKNANNREIETFLTATIPTDRSLAIGSLDGAATGTDALFVIDARQAGAADFDPSKRLVVFLDKPKRYRLPAATVRASAAGQPGTFTLTADQPAFFVKPEAQNFSGAFDDASFMLLPGESRTIAFRSFDGRVPEASDVTIRHLVAAYD
jgi:hypothetical protein